MSDGRIILWVYFHHSYMIITHESKGWKKNHTSIRRALHSISCSFSWVISGFKEDNWLLCSGVKESINSVSISARLEAMPALWASTWLWAVASNLFCTSKSNFQNLAYLCSKSSSAIFAVTSTIQTRTQTREMVVGPLIEICERSYSECRPITPLVPKETLEDQDQ